MPHPRLKPQASINYIGFNFSYTPRKLDKTIVIHFKKYRYIDTHIHVDALITHSDKEGNIKQLKVEGEINQLSAEQDIVSKKRSNIKEKKKKDIIVPMNPKEF
jgi:hypothetical protein